MILKRVLAAIPTLFLVTLLSFTLMRSLPGDPVEIMLGSAQKELPADDLKALQKEFGLDQNPAKQYIFWLKGWFDNSTPVTANALGRSYRDARPVKEVILERVPCTLALVGLALILAFVLGIVLGTALAFFALVSMRNQKTLARSADSLLTGALLAFYSAPNFWLAFLMLAAIQAGLVNLSVLGVHEPGQAITWAGLLTHMAAPALILASRRTAKVALFIRTLALEELGREYVITALAKGLSYPQVIFNHVLKNCLIPIASLIGLSLPALIGGSVLIETIFCVPGLGRLTVEATFGRNYPVLLGLVTLYGAAVIAANLLADSLTGLVDPRQRQGQEA